MSTELPVAVVTVRFDPYALSGTQVGALVQQISESDESRETSFVLERRFHDGDILEFGQSSGYPYQHIRVVPSLEGMPCFQPGGLYKEVKVVSHSWPTTTYLVGYSQEMVIDSVRSFASRLKAAYQLARRADHYPTLDWQSAFRS